MADQDTGQRLEQSFERFQQYEENQRTFGEQTDRLPGGRRSRNVPKAGQWNVSVHVPRPETQGQKKERDVRDLKAKTANLAATLAGTQASDDIMTGTGFDGPSAPSAKVVRHDVKRSHTYTAPKNSSTLAQSAQFTLRKPAMEGIESASQDPYFMVPTNVVSKTTTSLQEIVMATNRIIVPMQAENRIDDDAVSKPMPSFFPLEFFDDKTFETKTVEEWMQTEDGEPPKARSLWHIGDGTSEWKDVEVVGVSEQDESFSIKWLHNNKIKKASRLNVCFKDESLSRHEKRRQQALNNRARIEACMRYERMIDVMPTDKQLQLTPSQFHSIVRRIGMQVTGEQLKRNQELVEDVLHQYSRTINKMDFDAENPNADARSLADPILVHGLEELPIMLNKIPGRGVISTVPLHLVAGDEDSGQPPVVEADGEQTNFRSVVNAVERNLAWAPEHLLAALFSFQNQIAKLSSIHFLWDCSEAVQLKQFKERHVACWTRAIEDLTSTMMEAMTDSLLLAYTAEEAMSGHAMRPDQKDKYHRIVELANKMLRDAVRIALARDIQAYTERMESYRRPNRPPAPEADPAAAALPDLDADAALPEDAPADEAPELSGPEQAEEGAPAGEPAQLQPDQAEARDAGAQGEAAEEGAIPAETEAGEAGEATEPVDPTPGNWFGEKEQLPADLAMGVRAEHQPMFLVELKYDPLGKLILDPGVDDVETVAVSVIMDLVEATKTISSFQVEVINASATSTHLNPCAEPDFDAFVNDCVARVRRSVADNAFGPQALVQAFEEYPFLIETKVDEYVQTWHESAHPLADSKLEIERFVKAAEQVQLRFASDMVLRMYRVSCHRTKVMLAEKAQRLKLLMLNHISAEAREQCESMVKSFAGILAKLQESPEDPEQLAVLQEYVKTCDQEVDELALEISKAREKLDLLEAFEFDTTRDDFDLYWQAFGKPKEVDNVRQAAIPRQEDDRLKFMQKLQDLTADFQKELQSIEADINAFFTYNDLEQAEEYAGQVMVLNQKLKEATDTAQIINSREKLFEFPITGFEEIESMAITFKPYGDLWETAANFQKSFPIWMYGAFNSLDAEAIEQNVTSWWKFAWRAEKSFEGKEDPQGVAILLKEKLDAFKPNLPLIRGLRNPGMRDRHWAKLSSEVGTEIIPDVSITLKYLLEIDIQKYEQFITTLSEQAAKEYGFEKTLDKMKTEWRDLQFEFSPYKDTGTFTLKGIEETVMLLDDQIVKVQAMRGSPYAKPLESIVVEWSSKLVYMQDVLEEWLKCQKTWLYLEPIFASPDIMRQMPTEGRRFQKVDQMWRQTMQTGADAPAVLQVMSIDNLKGHFLEANKTLELVQKGLNDYLETKRSAFPRFYFLSNDELLDILSETKDPRRVVPHLPKAFEAICGVRFRGKEEADQAKGGENLDIMCMVSGEGEIVELSKEATVEPDAERNRGNVERWLLEMESSMRVTLKQIGRDAIAAYPNEERTKFVQSWTGMIVLAADCLYWTKDTEDAMKNRGVEGVKDMEKKMVSELAEIVQLVRGELSKQARLIIGAMVVLDVHNKDVTTLLVQNNVSSPADFDWNSQLRYYQESIEGELNIMTRMMNASLPYSYEYLGNSMRLVVTPLTDRCYRTLMGALHLSLGGAPEGPAGTGKTETVKDLSKAVAKQCVVFNCSDGLDYLAMAKFFKGLASCGAWACFDEFNRIDLEVLSVIAQQILTLSDGLRRGLKRITFEGSDIPLVKGFSSFITMNPGYAGRSELPDNLKALFRPCAMMVPDYAMISEICLYSYGFTDARDLARKLVKSLQISSEQLSSQVHYDFGMRAVKSILTAAGQLKRRFLQEQEDILVLRAINDVNLPKFTDADLPLFKGITSDLFLGLQVPTPDYTVLSEAMETACKQLIGRPPTAMTVSSFKTHSMNVQPTPQLLAKCIQLYETVTVRHSLMVVGLAMSMKTSVFKVLEYGMNLVKDKTRFEDVIMFTLNPKSITIDQIYGNFDPVSREWVEGIGASLVRKCAQFDADPDLAPKRKWILFDGPVDAIWIENMNTVMDDNKKLCLNSGEIIKLTGTMTMMFEPEDLAAASPATVSRNGMVLMEPHMLQWQSMVESWLELLPPPLESAKKHFNELFEFFVPPLLKLIKKECKEPVLTKETEQVFSLTKLLNSHITEFREEDSAKLIGGADIVKRVDGSFLFCLVWSIGCTTDEAGRIRFNEALRELLGKEGCPKITVPIPDKNTVYDFCWERNKMKWMGWLETIPQFSIPSTAKFQEILVPTIDTIRYGYVLETQVRNDYPVLFCGDTGTGKSVMVKEKLMKGMGDKFLSHFMNFSANSKANQTQDIIDGKVDKRRKGVFGPPLGKKLVVFVDDLNMPSKEAYGAQPPIEILRQHMHWGGWWDRKEIEWRQLVDMVYVAAMGLPGGGRTHLTGRYTRWYNMILVTPFDDEGMTRIFTTILGWWCMKDLPSVSTTAVNAPIVAATLEVFKTVSSELLPSPAKSHYTFNLRDLAKVIQGLMSVDPVSIGGAEDLFRLWVHECKRIFQDRLIDSKDQDWFHNMQGEVCLKHFKKPMKGIIGDGADGEGLLLYADFILDEKKAEADYEQRKYRQINDFQNATSIVSEFLDDYNQLSNKPMSLVLFGYVIEHICRLVRVFRQPAGHALLVGVGGSGRQSLTRLAGSMGEFFPFSIEITKNYDKTAWFEDLKTVFKKAGCEDKRTVFLFTDSQIVMESMLEDINNILNTGSVPNLFPPDEVMQVLDAVSAKARTAGRGLTPTDTFEFFIDQCRKNLHVVICMSPIGSGLRDRLRQFPSLVNCCTIDWFFPWPAEGLTAVASQSLTTIGLDEKDTQACIAQCMEFQVQAQELSKNYLEEVSRYNYVTPTSYLELISTFKSLLNVKKQEVGDQKARYEIGLKKLLSCAENVAKMEEELTALQPVLVVKTKEVEELIVVLDKETADATVTKETCAAEETRVEAEAAKTNELKMSCEADLAEIMPAIEGALAALKSLSKSDITEMKSMKNPPKGVKVVMETICIMLDVKPEKVTADDGKGKVNDYWKPSQKLLGDSNFMQKLLDYDKDHISANIITAIRGYLNVPDFQPSVIEKQSKAALGLCKWVRAMESYDKVAKEAEPKRIALKEAEEDLAIKKAELQEKRDALKVVLDKISDLEAKFKAANDEKVRIANEVDSCEKKLVRAGKLISGLGGEKTRWTENVKTLGEEFHNVTGDVLVSSAIVAYLGVFDKSYRDLYIETAMKSMKEKQIPGSDDVSLEKVLGNPVQIRDWNLAGLPRDSLSTDNAIVMSKSRRWPLMIDPQGQANKWIRNMEKENGLGVFKLSQSDFVRNIEACVSAGRPVLLENVGETIDSVLEPLLTKAVYKSGGSMVVNIGDSQVEYDENFKLYLTTKLPNPHYAPEVSTKVVLINFTITPIGLTDQLLGITVEVEKNEYEQERQRLLIQNAGFKKQLAEIEDKILKMLSEAGGDILEDEELINTLSASKVTSNEIGVALESAEETEKTINDLREKYTPYPKHGSLLFFCVAEMRNIEPMYQYSLDWFIKLFIDAMNNSEPNPKVEERVDILIDFFTFSLYRNVCRSLFEKDKVLYSFLFCSRLMLEQGKINQNDLRFLLSGVGGVSQDKPMDKPADWIPDRCWAEVMQASILPSFTQLPSDFFRYMMEWKAIYDSNDPASMEMPGDCETKYTAFQKICILRCLRPDKVVPVVQQLVINEMDKRYVEPPPFDLKLSYDDSTPVSPLIFVLSPGADPNAALIAFADSFGVQLESLSLGQGQGPIAQRMIEDAIDRGTWVVLQNCHLAPSWMPALEATVEGFSIERAHPQFRLWLTSYPSDKFPVSILQNGQKMTLQAPRGIRANMMNTYINLEEAYFETCAKPTELRKLHFGLAFFHALVQERRKFGPLGFNIPYEFTESDLKICQTQVKMFLDEYATIPWEALRYTAGETNYGGRVTEANDRRTTAMMLFDYYNPKTVNDSYKYSESGKYFAPPGNPKLKETMEHIQTFPMPEEEQPEVFGLHENANITSARNQTYSLFEAMLKLMPKGSTKKEEGAQTPEQLLEQLCQNMMANMPAQSEFFRFGLPFRVDEVQELYPTDYNESMNTVLTQELLRFNRVVVVIRNTLQQLELAVKGLIVMSGDLEQVANAFLVGQVPALWLKSSYPSLKPLASYFEDFVKRLSFLQKWIDEGPPPVFWLSGFYFTQSFLTGILQNYARKHKVAIDTLRWDFMVRLDHPTDKAEDGAYIEGLFIDGAAWDQSMNLLCEQRPKVLFEVMPIIQLLPILTSEFALKPGDYPSPLYKTSARRGTLSTTGHSTNFVMQIILPTNREEAHWVKRGVALLSQLDD